MTRQRSDTLIPRWKTAQRLARKAHLTSDHHAVLGAVIYLLVAHQRIEDRISIAQVAMEGGFDQKAQGDPTRHEKRVVGILLQDLADAGAIHYEPRAGRARAGLVALPEPDPCLFTDKEWRAFQDARPDDGHDDLGARPSTRAQRAPKLRGRAPQTARPDDADCPGRAQNGSGRAESGPSDPLGARPNPLGARPGTRASEGSEGLPEDLRGGRAAHAASVTSGGDAGAGDRDGVPPVIDGPPPDDIDTYAIGTAWIVSRTEAYVLMVEHGRKVLDYLDPRHHPDLTTLTATQRLDLLEDQQP